jgi:hypothetical protein
VMVRVSRRNGSRPAVTVDMIHGQERERSAHG